MSERQIEIVREPDGSFSATYDDRHPAVAVTSWAEIRKLRSRHQRGDQWAPGAREAFIAEHGHPFDDWWASLSANLQAALLADPDGPVPSAYAEEIRTSLRSENGRDGLRVDGSSFTPAVREFLALRARDAATTA